MLLIAAFLLGANAAVELKASLPVFIALPAQDCVISESPWSKCDFENYQNRTNVVLVPGMYGGNACPELFQVQECNSNCDMKIVNWGICDFPTGTTMRSKTLVYRNPVSIADCPAEVSLVYFLVIVGLRDKGL